jgi:hypothetical protein
MIDYAQTRIKEEIDEYLYPIEGGDIETDTEE